MTRSTRRILLSKQRAAQFRELMKLLCWPLALILAAFGHLDAALMVAAFDEFGSGAATRLSR